jgi:hypothetical protein
MMYLYSRQNCSLCDQFEHELQLLTTKTNFDWQKVDVDSDPVLQSLYGNDVPVLTLKEEIVCQHFFDEEHILKALS